MSQNIIAHVRSIKKSGKGTSSYENIVMLHHPNIVTEIMMKECETSFLRFMEGFMEAAPQLILQLTILKMSRFNLFSGVEMEGFNSTSVVEIEGFNSTSVAQESNITIKCM